MIIGLFFVIAALSFNYSLMNVSAEALENSVTDHYKNNKSEDNVSKDNSNNDEPVNQSTKVGIGVLDVIKMIAALLFVVFLLYILLKFINKKSQSYQHNKLVQNYGGTALGGNRSIQIVKVGRQILILGVGEDIRLLKEITDEEELQDYIRLYKEQQDQSLQPTDVLTKWLKANKQKNLRSSNQNGDKAFHVHLKEKLDEIKKDRKKVISELEEKEQRFDE